MVTPRQREVLVGVASGLSDKAIALHMEISVATIRSHVSAIRSQAPADLPFDIGTRAGLVRYHDWLQPGMNKELAENLRVPVLVIQRLGEDPVIQPLLRDQYSLGRSPRADIVLDSPYVSSFHARLATTAEQCAIEDTQSKNGTRFNGELLAPGTPRIVKPSDTIGIGEFTLVLVERSVDGPTKTL